MARTLNTRVIFRDPSTGQPLVLGPGDDVPEWAAEQVGEASLWEQGSDPEPTGDAPQDAPPQSGAGSGRDAWAAYAAEKGLTVTDDMTRADIITALESQQ